jgi:hypothetical protein
LLALDVHGGAAGGSTMTKLSIVLAGVLSLAVIACVAEESPTDDTSSELALETEKPSDDVSIQGECRSPGIGNCTGDEFNCRQDNYEEVDCGAPYCLEENHCGGDKVRFQHVEHWDRCEVPDGTTCHKLNYIGRYQIGCC